MLAAESASESLAADLKSSATSFQSMLSGLTGAWQGPSATQMATSALPSWPRWPMLPGRRGGPASTPAAAAAAYKVGVRGPRAPPKIAMNRVDVDGVGRDDFFGQNGRAIAVTETLLLRNVGAGRRGMIGHGGEGGGR